MAEEIRPNNDQITIKWGRVSIENGVRRVESTEEEYQEHNQHGPKTYYKVPFDNGTFSLSWKRDSKKKLNLIFQTEEKGKAVHLFKVFINGSPTKNTSKTDILSFVTYAKIAGSHKKKAKVTTKKYHAKADEWHKTSIEFKGNRATVRIDDQVFVIEDERFQEEIIHCGVGHVWGVLETKDVKITKN
jgi:hypothetical protein